MRGTARRSRSWRERLTASAAGVAVVVVALAAVEGIVRIVASEPRDPYPMLSGPGTDPVFIYDPVLFWRPKPDMERPDLGIFTNSLGLRDDPFPPPGPAPGFTALCLGDSVTWGDGVLGDEAYPNVLEHLVRERFPGLTASLLNAGVAGYSTLQSLELARQLLDRFRFDLVTIGCLHGHNNLAAQEDREYVLSPLQIAVLRPLLRSWTFRYTRRLFAADLPPTLGAVYGPEMTSRVPAAPDYEDNLGQMVTLAQEHGAEVLLLTFFPTQVADLQLPSATPTPQEELRAYIQQMSDSEPAYKEAMARIRDRFSSDK